MHLLQSTAPCCRTGKAGIGRRLGIAKKPDSLSAHDTSPLILTWILAPFLLQSLLPRDIKCILWVCLRQVKGSKYRIRGWGCGEEERGRRSLSTVSGIWAHLVGVSTPVCVGVRDRFACYGQPLPVIARAKQELADD